MRLLLLTFAFIGLLAAACSSGDTQQVFQATLPSTEQNAPIYTETSTSTSTHTLTHTPSPTMTATPTATRTSTPSFTPTPSSTPTVSLLTLTPASTHDAPTAYQNPTAELTTPEGWSCGDFPCEDDIVGFMGRIRVPDGYTLSHIGRFPGQPMQITYGPDDRLYATVLENGTRNGAIYALDADGNTERYSGNLISPIGLAFQPGTDTLYVSARLTPTEGGALWRIRSDGTSALVLDNLPCCYSVIDNQPNGMTFGPDGYLYMGVGALTDHAEPPNPDRQQYADIHPLEAAILRIHPHTGEVETIGRGIRNPYDLTFDSNGRLYVTDNGLATGQGDRLLRVETDGHYGWPYWRTRGCEDCPARDPRITIAADLLPFSDYTLPRGIVAYTGTQFPQNVFDSLFIALWHQGESAQRIIRVEPGTLPVDPEARTLYLPEPFITGLIRPVDVVVAPDGSLVIADFIYGHVWRVSYGDGATTQNPPQHEATATTAAALFVTATPRS